MRAIITGGAEFVGSHAVCAHILSQGTAKDAVFVAGIIEERYL